MVGIVFTHQARRQCLRKKVVVERVFLRDYIPIDGVAVIRPIGQIGADFALAGRVVEIAVLDRLGAAHLVDADVAIRNRAVRQHQVHSERSEQHDRATGEDEPIGFPLGIVRRIDFVADVVNEQRLRWRQRSAGSRFAHSHGLDSSFPQG